jgi:hypothetical protein
MSSRPPKRERPADAIVLRLISSELAIGELNDGA